MKVDFKQFIVYEDNDFLVINKPANLLVQPTKYQKENTLIDYLKEYYPKLKEVGESLRPGLVHRLDKDVSGLMVIAKTKESYTSLISQFKNHQVKKVYLGLVSGHPPEEKGLINFPLARTKNGKIVAVRYEGKIKMKKEAETKYKVINKFKKYSLLKIEPSTGRTNQIKVHLKAIGCPLVEVGNRVFLHAACLGFHDLKNKWQEFESVLPAELKDFLSALGGSSVGGKEIK